MHDSVCSVDLADGSEDDPLIRRSVGPAESRPRRRKADVGPPSQPSRPRDSPCVASPPRRHIFRAYLLTCSTLCQQSASVACSSKTQVTDNCRPRVILHTPGPVRSRISVKTAADLSYMHYHRVRARNEACSRRNRRRDLQIQAIVKLACDHADVRRRNPNVSQFFTQHERHATPTHQMQHR